MKREPMETQLSSIPLLFESPNPSQYMECDSENRKPSRKEGSKKQIIMLKIPTEISIPKKSPRPPTPTQAWRPVPLTYQPPNATSSVSQPTTPSPGPASLHTLASHLSSPPNHNISPSAQSPEPSPVSDHNAIPSRPIPSHPIPSPDSDEQLRPSPDNRLKRPRGQKSKHTKPTPDSKRGKSHNIKAETRETRPKTVTVTVRHR